jgi:serine/threonine protein kinase
MDKTAALARLGITEDHAANDATVVTRAYGEALSNAQERLVSAKTDSERVRTQTELSGLVDAYEYLTSTGRYTRARPVDEGNATMLRSETELSATKLSGGGTGTLVRMESGAVLGGRLEIGALLGQGGMGNVYAARDRLKDMDVAIKVLRQDLVFSQFAKDRFLAEAKVSCSLSHPNIVRVHDVGVAGDYYYFSMERLQGHTLRARMEAYNRESRPMGVEEVTDIARQLIEALKYAHRYIVHRDIKPENIWLAEDGTVKLMDFGIARAYSNSQLTQTGMTLGTAYYMAPEQRIAAKEVDWRADQYALGIVLYEMFAGTLPTGAVKPLELVRRDMPKRYARALMRAMAPKPDDRFASLNDLLTEIEVRDRKMPFGVGGMLLLIGGLAAAAGAGVYVINGGSLPWQKTGTTEQTATTTQDASTQTQVQTQTAQDTTAQGSTNAGSTNSGSTGLAAGTTGTSTTGTSASDSGGPSTGGTSGGDNGGSSTPPTGSSGTEQVASSGGSSVGDEAGAGPGEVSSNATSGGVASPVDNFRPAGSGKPRVDSTLAGRRELCVRQCDRDEGQCRSIGRQGKQDCMRAIAFGANARLPGNNNAARTCGYFGSARCENAIHQDACLARMSDRYQSCVGVIGNIAQGRQDCENTARESDKLCLTELRSCRDSCQ